MPEKSLNILAVMGSPKNKSITRAVLVHLAENLAADGCAVDILDLQTDPLPLYSPDTAHDAPEFKTIQARVERADVIILGTPDYHGSISSTLKNFLDYFWYEFAGKLFVPMVASHEKGLTVIDQLRTVARQCYAWILPYGFSFAESDLKDGLLHNETLKKRLEMLRRDARVYGQLIADQRRADLSGADPCIMARHRK